VVSVRKAVLSLSVLILLAGAIIFSFSNQFLESPENEEVNRHDERPYGSWNISALYSESEKLLVSFTRPKIEFAPDGIALIGVNITDPHRGNTTFEIEFSGSELVGSAEIRLLDEGEGLIVENPEFEVGGVTVYAGNYTAHVFTYAKTLAYIYYDDAKLPFMQLFKEDITREYPNRAFLPVGVGLVIAGLALLVWSVKSS